MLDNRKVLRLHKAISTGTTDGFANPILLLFISDSWVKFIEGDLQHEIKLVL